MNKRLIIITLLSIAFIALVVTKLLFNKEKAENQIYIHDAEAAVLVEAIQPVMHTFESAYSYLGSFEAIRQNTISSDAQGKLISLLVQEGDRVAQGQTLAKIDDDLLRLQLENINVSIEGQQNDNNRFSALADDKAVPGVQVEKSKLGLRALEIQRKQIEKQLRSTSITAPFSGVVTKKMVDLGSFIGAGMPVVEITDISSLKLTVNVPERDILKFKTGQQVVVTTDLYKDKSFDGVVTNVGVQADRSHNFKVQITIKNEKQQLMSGMYGSVSLPNTQRVTALSIPRKALIGSSKKPQVYRIKNGKAILTPFNAGTSDGEFIEVVSGLTIGDRIVIKGQVNLQDNANVKTK